MNPNNVNDLNIDQELLNSYNKSVEGSELNNYKFQLNEEYLKHIWYHNKAKITPKENQKISKSFNEIKEVLYEKDNVLKESRTHLAKYLNKKNNINIIDISILIFILYIILVIILNY